MDIRYIEAKLAEHGAGYKLDITCEQLAQLEVQLGLKFRYGEAMYFHNNYMYYFKVHCPGSYAGTRYSVGRRKSIYDFQTTSIKCK